MDSGEPSRALIHLCVLFPFPLRAVDGSDFQSLGTAASATRVSATESRDWTFSSVPPHVSGEGFFLHGGR